MRNAGFVIIGTVVATGLTVLNDLLNDRKSMRPVIGGFVVGTVLLLIAMFNTAIAAAMAMLLLLTSVLKNGVPILQRIPTL